MNKLNDKFIFKGISYKTIFCLLLYQLLPSIWIILRTHFISIFNYTNISTYAQWTYIDTMLEVIKEGLILPLFWWVGSKINKNLKNEMINKTQTVYFYIFIIYCLLITVLSFLTNDFVKILNSTVNGDKTFFILQLWSKVPNLLFLTSMVILSYYDKKIFIIVLTFFQLLFGVSFDYLFGQVLFKNNLTGIGVSTFLTNIIIFILSFLFVLKTLNISFKNYFCSIKIINAKKYLKPTFWSFLDSFVRNFFYILIVARFMNEFGSDSNSYWIANTIIWNIILIPVLASADIHKSDTVKNLTNSKKMLKILLLYQLFALILFFGMLTIIYPFYQDIAFFMSNNKDVVNNLKNIFDTLIWFYICFVICTICDSVFYGTGKTFYMAMQSILVNFLFYIPLFIVYKLSIWKPGVYNVAFMYGLAMFCDMFFSGLMLFFLFRKMNLRKYSEN